MNKLITKINKASETTAGDWLSNIRKEGLAKLLVHGLPTKKDEAWKQSRLRVIEDIKQNAVLAVKDDVDLATVSQVLAKNNLFKTDDLRLVFYNGVLVSDFSKLQASDQMVNGLAADGLVLDSLSSVCYKQPDLVENKLGGLIEKTHGLGWFNAALAKRGAVVVVPDNFKLETRLELIFITDGQEEGQLLHAPHNLIILKDNSKLNLTEHFLGADGDRYFNNVVTEIYLGKRAELEHQKFQAEGDQAVHFGSTFVKQDAASIYNSWAMYSGGDYARNEIKVDNAASGTSTKLNGLFLAKNQQEQDNVTQITHRADKGKSTQDYRGLISDEAQGIFNGVIEVQKNANQNKTAQLNKNLLLSKTAKVNSRPQLVLENDDVDSTHGSATGQLDAEALYYLQTRGLAKKEAKQVLLKAFVGELFDSLDRGSIKSYISKKAEEWLR